MSAFGQCGDALLGGHRIEPQPSRGGAPAGTGLQLEQLVRATIALREPDGTWPTQLAVAGSLGLTGEWIRRIGKPAGGWRRGVLRLAAAELGSDLVGLTGRQR